MAGLCRSGWTSGFFQALAKCWANVSDVGPAFSKRLAHVPCMSSCRQFFCCSACCHVIPHQQGVSIRECVSPKPPLYHHLCLTYKVQILWAKYLIYYHYKSLTLFLFYVYQKDVSIYVGQLFIEVVFHQCTQCGMMNITCPQKLQKSCICLMTMLTWYIINPGIGKLVVQ